MEGMVGCSVALAAQAGRLTEYFETPRLTFSLGAFLLCGGPACITAVVKRGPARRKGGRQASYWRA